jgi:hypothetical protein
MAKKFCKHQIYHYRNAVSGYHSNALSNVNMLHEHKLCSGLRMCEQSFDSIVIHTVQQDATIQHSVSMYCVYSVSTDNILM